MKSDTDKVFWQQLQTMPSQVTRPSFTTLFLLGSRYCITSFTVRKPVAINQQMTVFRAKHTLFPPKRFVPAFPVLESSLLHFLWLLSFLNFLAPEKPAANLWQETRSLFLTIAAI